MCESRKFGHACMHQRVRQAVMAAAAQCLAEGAVLLVLAHATS